MPHDPSQNFIHRFPQPLDAVFLPKSVAVIGAKDTMGSVGRTILVNLLEGKWEGNLYPVNPKRQEVLGLKCYPSIGEIPEEVDLAVIVTPSKTVPGLIRECVAAHVKAAIIISAGFKELGPPGVALEEEILEVARGKIRLIGPNCLGVMNPVLGMNATFARGMAEPGNVAFISQSGAMCTAVLDWSYQEQIGFSAFVSIGSMIDVDWGDLIDYLGGDPNTHSILIYMETIGDPRSFLSAAREIALEKPIIVIKPGRTAEAAEAAASHTGSLAGSDEVFEAALERVGVLRVESISELFSMASVLARQPLPKGPRLTIVTNAGGPAVLATDATIMHGAEVAPLSNETITKLNDVLPEAWSHANPVDILGDAGADRYMESAKVLAGDTNSDGTLFILSPQDMTDPVATAEALRPYAHQEDKPILASWMGGKTVQSGIETLVRAGIPTFGYPDQAAWVFATMWRYHNTLQTLYETPSQLIEHPKEHQKAKDLIDQVRQEGRELLDEYESKKLLAYYGIPTVATEIATTEDEAVAWAEKIGFPAVLKLFSKTITHKTDVGGVILNLESPEAVKEAFQSIQQSVTKKVGAEHFQGVTVQKMAKLSGYELIIGSSVDPQFGPVLLFGTGGQLVEVYKDRALALPPLGPISAEHLMEKTKIYEALKGVRGRQAVDLDALKLLLIHFSQLITDNPEIKELDINPLLASPEGLLALDARVVLYRQNTKLPKLSIRPYPAQYIRSATLTDNTEITLRPIKPEDEPMMVAFHKELSEDSIRQRYFSFITLDERISHERLVRICFNDFDREMAIVAEHERQIIGAARLSRMPGTRRARLVLIIIDRFHRKGLGRLLIEQLLHIAKVENITEIFAKILSENTGMIALLESYGFSIKSEGELILATKDLLQANTKSQLISPL